jgi:hypothetical protein
VRIAGRCSTPGICNTRAIASVRNAAPKWKQPKKKKNTGKQGKSKCGTVYCFYYRALKTKEIATIEQPIFFLVKRSKNNTFTKVTVLNTLSRKHSNFATLYADTSKTVLHALGEMMYMTWITIRTFNSH